MTHDYAAVVRSIRSATDQLEARQPMPGVERVELWQDVRDARNDLDLILRDLETDATDALVELLRESGDDELATDLGVVHVEWAKANERWEGWKLLGALARWRWPTVTDEASGEIRPDPNGAPERDVALDVLRDVVSGCASEDQTSSRWRKTAVRKYVGDERRYYDADAPRQVIRPGPKR